MKHILTLPLLMALFLLAACTGSADTAVPAEGASAPGGSVSASASAQPASRAASVSPAVARFVRDTLGDEQAVKGHKVVVAFFSATGHTQKIAEQIAAQTNAALYPIIPAEPYSEADLDWHNKESRSSLEMHDAMSRPELGGSGLSLQGYDTIYLGYPIWWGEAPRVISTFVEKYSLKGLTVIPFCTSGGSGMGESAKLLQKQAGAGDWKEGAEL